MLSLSPSCRYSAYLKCGLETKEVRVGKMTFSYFDRTVPEVTREDGSVVEPETVLLFHGYTACKTPMGRWTMLLAIHNCMCYIWVMWSGQFILNQTLSQVRHSKFQMFRKPLATVITD